MVTTTSVRSDHYIDEGAAMVDNRSDADTTTADTTTADSPIDVVDRFLDPHDRDARRVASE